MDERARTQQTEQPVSFFQDDGLRIEGDLYCSAAPPELGVVFCHGWGGTRGATAPAIARGLTARLPAAVLVFDYTGWGTSEGARDRLDPEREIADVRCAVSYLLATRPDLGGRVGLFGLSFGGSIATSAAARDGRVRALMAVPTAASGERLVREQREHWRYVEYLEKVEADRLQRVVSGRSERVDPDWISIRDATAAAYVKKLAETDPSRHFDLDLVSAERILEMAPDRDAVRLRDRPSVFIAMGSDLRTPTAQCRDVAAIAGGRYIEVPGLGHYDLYAPERLEWLLDVMADFYRGALGARAA
jgi:pimeloyl-ACP methyl ester carboxylesterase